MVLLGPRSEYDSYHVIFMIYIWSDRSEQCRPRRDAAKCGVSLIIRNL